MNPFIKRILRFDFLRKKEREETLIEILIGLKNQGEIEIYETYENGEWDFAIKKKDERR